MNKDKSALIVIDLQNDFTQKNGKVHACISQVDIIVPRINNLIKDSENKNVEVIYLKTEWKNLLIKLLTKNSVKPGSSGAQIDERLTSLNKTVFMKNNKNIFSSQEFIQYINTNKINKLYLTGLAVEHCIKVSFDEAKSLNLDVYIVSDAVISYKCTELIPLLNKHFPKEKLVTINSLLTKVL